MAFWYISCFWGTRYRYFQQVTTSSQRVAASVTILLLEICTIFNTTAFVVHNQMLYCTCYHTFWMQQVNICTIFNALPRVNINFLKKKYTVIFFYKIFMYLFLSKCIVTWTVIHLILHRKWSCVKYCNNCLLKYGNAYGNALVTRW